MRPSLNQNLWFDTLGEPITYRSALSADIHADVAIIGAGYSGLWSALRRFLLQVIDIT
ncbi:hypothetical protein LZP69_01200 [Shewanella sp. AS1]|uniref:hypothetical protein n=1 Tax=Shewanella sp. AS1 TaxID=2907626 RepID=UPI001F3AC8B7|nr:hypothetical protein [Shewanella sp. AS1]MCE9677808.1 hypothetical protein [Shewanella sp. AS1]